MKNQSTFALSFQKKTVTKFENASDENRNRGNSITWGTYFL